MPLPQDVVGIKSKKCVNSILSFLDPSVGRSEPSIEEMVPYEPAIIDILTNYSGLSLDRLHNMLCASATFPRFVFLYAVRLGRTMQDWLCQGALCQPAHHARMTSCAHCLLLSCAMVGMQHLKQLLAHAMGHATCVCMTACMPMM